MEVGRRKKQEEGKSEEKGRRRIEKDGRKKREGQGRKEEGRRGEEEGIINRKATGNSVENWLKVKI
jgi:hypothetical protein